MLGNFQLQNDDASNYKDPVDPATAQLKNDLIQWHYQIVQMCWKLDIPDVCDTYIKSRRENILNGSPVRMYLANLQEDLH